MNAAEMNSQVLTPALELLPARMDSIPARRELLAIQYQEDPKQLRRQWPSGPAHGLWQFEEHGGVAGVLEHHTTSNLAAQVCAARRLKVDAYAVWLALPHDDILAAAFGRLLLWTDPKPLPNDAAGGWAYYLRTWRPGRPHISRWRDAWDRAVEAVG